MEISSSREKKEKTFTKISGIIFFHQLLIQRDITFTTDLHAKILFVGGSGLKSGIGESSTDAMLNYLMLYSQVRFLNEIAKLAS